MSITTNEHVNYTINQTYGFVEFTPDEGYALWRDDEEGNLDENGEPMCYWLTIGCPNEAKAIERAPHIWAKLIDDTMEVYGKTDPNQPMLMSLDDEEPVEPSHTYIDENGVEREKHGVY